MVSVEFLTKLKLNGETNLMCITVMPQCYQSGDKSLVPVSWIVIGDCSSKKKKLPSMLCTHDRFG